MDVFRKHHLEKIDKDKQIQANLPKPEEDPLPEPVKPIQTDKVPDRNDPCPCGSGKKFKKCCSSKK